MRKVVFITILLCLYIAYSCWVYISGTSLNPTLTKLAIDGKTLWHENNCQNCHQIYGLGGYMGPDLTTVTTDVTRGRVYAKAMLMNGGNRMPNFHFNEREADQLVAYLDYINNTTCLQKQ